MTSRCQTGLRERYAHANSGAEMAVQGAVLGAFFGAPLLFSSDSSADFISLIFGRKCMKTKRNKSKEYPPPPLDYN
jgi:hypothetical protein